MSTALYRRYRPESFADVIGQEHVTEPLMQALRSGRVNHAYLFSGPRGCGKTTSARILARCLNCEQGPTPDPCGACQSCVALARDGAGSVDVIEIDAASHGGVDDARDLRERAAFGPAQSRYKVYIIDEAHMVTPNGFNALLKVVEEPPPHVKFIFATTEPEKVLATIRSRTHHYPFHLVPPQRLTTYLEQLCEQEDVALEPGVLSFVTRAGGGSVRDSLSVLDQLISGAGEQGLTYERTAALLGFTDVELLDAVVDAVAAGDAATVFGQVDKVMESGHDPRRFVEDLLERYRDLIVLSAVGDAAAAAGLLPGLPADQIERMRHQASVQGPEVLSRAADIISRGLSEMTGAVSFRLMLELLVARLLLPAAEGEEGYGARLDRIERRLTASDGAATGSSSAGPAVTPPQEPRPAAPADAPDESRHVPGPDRSDPERAQPAPERAQPPPAPEQPSPSAPGALDTAALRRQWPDVLERVRLISRRTWSGLQMAVLLDYDGRRVLLGMPDENWIRHFIGTQHQEALRQALIEAIALDTQVEAVVTGPGGGPDDASAPSGPPPSGPPPSGPPPSGPPPSGPPPSGQPTPAPTSPQQQGGAPPAGPATGSDAPPAGPPPGVRIRTRANPNGAAAGAPVRTAPQPPGRPAQGPAGDEPATRQGHASQGNAPGPGPTVADQLGAGASTTTAAGPDWAQQARTTSAPAWAAPGPGEATTETPAARVRSRAAAAPAVAPPGGPAAPETALGGQVGPGDGDAPSEDDEDLASSKVVGQPVIESVLGGTVIAINDDPVA
ncbi:DNA polymerase III subunit gamma and tau [Ornithinimicrobium pekingense]|uniref:DNA polymerase III subunit gamma/tau n=1 Tax=Ornithinimicrobium pekingense TaxID=384677 RepID=A0ABQ2F6G5_9MICO|nr:DNA polymerase III subunit gamma and tau [Ornithinimicrobium pekingense]GGK57516.1 hypothetical protein GCM10011509_02370 [Ornithinimicrobium pekingense]